MRALGVVIACASAACLAKPELPGSVGSCTHFGPWGSVQDDIFQAVNTSSHSEWGAWLSPDTLELVFASDRDGTSGIYQALRATPSAAFDPPAKLVLDPPPAFDGDPFVTDDDTQIWYSALYPDVDITAATRTGRDAAFGPSVHQGPLNTSAAESDPELSHDLLTLYYTSSFNGSKDIWVATRKRVEDQFDGGVVITALSGNLPSTAESGDSSPTVSADGLDLFFDSDRSGTVTNLYEATRTDATTPQFTTTRFAPTMGTTDDGDPYLSRDGRMLVFHRFGGTSRDLVYVERGCLD
jgi:Tol biopolymer transport system component